MRLIPAAVQAVVLSTVLDLFFSRKSSQNDDLAEYLDALDGRVYHIHVRDTGMEFYMGFKAGRAWVHTSSRQPADVRIDATTGGFARLCFAREDADDLVFQQVLKLSGDSEAMLRFKKLLAVADIDWERELRDGFGEYFGSRVAQAAKALIALETKASAGVHEAVSGCLKGMDVPDEARLNAWQAGVEDTTRRLSRLKGRVTKLEHRLRAEQDKKNESEPGVKRKPKASAAANGGDV
ncbi:MAG: SCP2 sterol-binding domain-containing protein [Mariprofundaceae bacterium]|nr:SCP2 sterol-binding domain-containing protein [Mariprofundaceae bacterium]